MTNKTKKRRKRKLKLQQREMLAAEREQKKRIRHNTAVNQEKHRTDWQSLQPDEFGLIADRRIMPRDEQDRRAGLKQAATQLFNGRFDESKWIEAAAQSPFSLGVVVEVSRGLCRVSVNDQIIICDIRGILTAEGSGFTNIVAVGDRALVRPQADDRGLIEAVLPRRSGLARADTYETHLKQIIAANVDQLLIIASWREPHIWLRLIDEYLIGAARNNLDAAVCVNKIDLAEDETLCWELIRPYADLGYRIHLTSAETGVGLESLRQELSGKTSVLAGLSGVGKSSLLTALEPGLNLRVKRVSEKRREGRHTTTQAIMLPFGEDGYVVDTPGIREMGLSGLLAAELIDFYPDVAAFVDGCRFSDCTHAHEPGCAVKTAVTDGHLLDWRLENYNKLYQSLST